jgi:D-beta-D-heptose 7-phosphate kinase/D-beta-D-heptose 1-phosphate adenosyltransferase
MALLGITTSPPSPERVQGLQCAGDRLLEATGASLCAVTLDGDGALVFERKHWPHRVFARPAPAAQSTGAGDTFAAALTLALAAGADSTLAADLAAVAAGAVVGRNGTVACTLDDLRMALRMQRRSADLQLARR